MQANLQYFIYEGFTAQGTSLNSLAYSLKLQHNFFTKLYTVILSLIHLFLVFFIAWIPTSLIISHSMQLCMTFL